MARLFLRNNNHHVLHSLASLKCFAVLWFYDQISQFTPAQQEAIKACVEKFLRNRYTSGPEETISRVGLPYTQQKLYEIVSAFMLLDKSREQCADFAKEVFTDFFWNTETKTIERKLKGKDKILLIIDTY